MAGPATAARYHGVASIPHPRSGVSIRKQPVVSARNVNPTLHASFSRQAWFNRKKFGIYSGSSDTPSFERGMISRDFNSCLSLSLFFLGIFDRRGIDCIVNKWGGDSESREWGMEESVIWSVNLDMLIFRWMVTFKWMFANGSFT